MDLALNNLQRLICHKTQQTKPYLYIIIFLHIKYQQFISNLKVTQCSTSKIGDAPLYSSCTLPIQVMTTGPLPAPSKCKSRLPRITETCPGWWKQSFQQQLWSLMWFQVRATSCLLTSSKSAWKSTPKCTWMCWNVWWSLGAIISINWGRVPKTRWLKCWTAVSN